MFRILKYDLSEHKKRGEIMSPRMGRPKSDNPKNIDIKVRIDEKTNERLKRYAEKKNLTRTEVVRQGIDRILDSDK